MLYLRIRPLMISEKQWADVWDTSLNLITNWDPPLIRQHFRMMADVAVPVYTTRVLAKEDYWEISGDRHTNSIVGRFGLYRDLGLYQLGAYHRVESLFNEGKPDFVVRVFENKHYNKPYLRALLAVGMVIEEAMGENAVMSGEFEWEDILAAEKQTKRILGRTFTRPHVCNRKWVELRLASQHKGKELKEWVNSYHVTPRKNAAQTSYGNLFFGRPYQNPWRPSDRMLQVASSAWSNASQLPDDRYSVLNQLAKNMLVGNFWVNEEIIDEFQSLPLDQLKWLANITDSRNSDPIHRDAIASILKEPERRTKVINLTRPDL